MSTNLLFFTVDISVLSTYNEIAEVVGCGQGRYYIAIATVFYAAVEAQEHPELRGKNIAVCGDPKARHGIILTASYPAKRMGVKTGMAIWQAQQRCRDLILVPAHYSEYMRYSGFVREIFEQYTDQVEPFGLDESWLDVTGSCGLFGSGMSIAADISRKIKKNWALRCQLELPTIRSALNSEAIIRNPMPLPELKVTITKRSPTRCQSRICYMLALPQRGSSIDTGFAQSAIWHVLTWKSSVDGSAKRDTSFPALLGASIKHR